MLTRGYRLRDERLPMLEWIDSSTKDGHDVFVDVDGIIRSYRYSLIFFFGGRLKPVKGLSSKLDRFLANHTGKPGLILSNRALPLMSVSPESVNNGGVHYGFWDLGFRAYSLELPTTPVDSRSHAVAITVDTPGFSQRLDCHLVVEVLAPSDVQNEPYRVGASVDGKSLSSQECKPGTPPGSIERLKFDIPPDTLDPGRYHRVVLSSTLWKTGYGRLDRRVVRAVIKPKPH